MTWALNVSSHLIFASRFFLQWNNHGYNIAKIFANKFEFVSPVWLQVKPTPNRKNYIISGDGHYFCQNLSVASLYLLFSLFLYKTLLFS